PPELSTDKTSLNEEVDRAALVIDMTFDAAGTLGASDVYRATVRNHAQLTYSGVAAWLDGHGPEPAAVSKIAGLDEQVRLQDRIAAKLQACRDAEGALDFDRSELRPEVDDN